MFSVILQKLMGKTDTLSVPDELIIQRTSGKSLMTPAEITEDITDTVEALDTRVDTLVSGSVYQDLINIDNPAVSGDNSSSIGGLNLPTGAKFIGATPVNGSDVGFGATVDSVTNIVTITVPTTPATSAMFMVTYVG